MCEVNAHANTIADTLALTRNHRLCRCLLGLRNRPVLPGVEGLKEVVERLSSLAGYFTTPLGRKTGRSLAVEQQLRKKIIELKTDSAFCCVIWVDKGPSCRRKMNHEEGRRLYEEQGPALLGYACDLLGARASAVSSVKR